MKKTERKVKRKVNTDNKPSVTLPPLYTLGVDEVGRGPLAGPVTVCVSLIPQGAEFSIKKELKRISDISYPVGKDSKKMTEQEREFWFAYLKVFEKLHDVYFAVGSLSAKEIDRKGIAVCIKKLANSLTKKVIQKVGATSELCALKADAGLRVDLPFAKQEAIIKGDEKEFVISIASVYAKVTRDSYMKRISKKAEFSKYGFGVHKGYGTVTHRSAIKKYGLSREHRVSFCKNIAKR